MFIDFWYRLTLWFINPGYHTYTSTVTLGEHQIFRVDKSWCHIVILTLYILTWSTSLYLLLCSLDFSICDSSSTIFSVSAVSFFSAAWRHCLCFSTDFSSFSTSDFIFCSFSPAVECWDSESRSRLISASYCSCRFLLSSRCLSFSWNEGTLNNNIPRWYFLLLIQNTQDLIINTGVHQFQTHSSTLHSCRNTAWTDSKECFFFGYMMEHKINAENSSLVFQSMKNIHYSHNSVYPHYSECLIEGDITNKLLKLKNFQF